MGKCKDCGLIVKGRSDKQFCSEHCRNNYHNQFNRDANNYMRKVNNILRKNRRILEKVYKENKDDLPVGHLLNLGFNFDYFTGREITNNDFVVHYCYEYGYLTTRNGKLISVKKYEA